MSTSSPFSITNLLPSVIWQKYENTLRSGNPGAASPIADHTSVDTTYERGWQTLENGELLRAAEADGYDILITTDQNLRYQQNLAERKIGIVILMSTSWPKISKRLEAISEIVESAVGGSYYEIAIP